jgi:16S rRNA processing protein RimM
MPVAERICVGRIGAAHGTRGEVKLWSYTADPTAISSYGALESADGARALRIEALRPGKGFLVARFAGVADRTAAERLRNIDLYVARDRLPAVQASDEFYHADLLGLAAMDARGETLGTVTAIHNFGAGDLIEIAPAKGGNGVLIPFTDAAVPVVDIGGGRIVIDPPNGLFGDGSASRED